MKQAASRLLLISTVIFGSCGVPSLCAHPTSQQVKSRDKPQFVAPESIEGCYELALSDWQPNLKLGEDVIFITPPHRIQLFAEPGKEGWESNGYIVKPAPGVRASIHRGAWWLPKGPTTIEIVWTTGFSGLSMSLKLEGSELRGKAFSSWDFDRTKQTAEVVARRVDCQESENGDRGKGRKPLAEAPPDFPQTEREHFLENDFTIVRDVKALPGPVLEALAEQVGSRVVMANPGKDFIAGDVIYDSSLPSQRLIFGGVSGEKCFVQYEQGGRAHLYVLSLLLLRPPSGVKPLWRGYCRGPAANLSDLRSQLHNGHCK